MATAGDVWWQQRVALLGNIRLEQAQGAMALLPLQSFCEAAEFLCSI